jgi:hypothetical protein
LPPVAPTFKLTVTFSLCGVRTNSFGLFATVATFMFPELLVTVSVGAPGPMMTFLSASVDATKKSATVVPVSV